MRLLPSSVEHTNQVIVITSTTAIGTRTEGVSDFFSETFR